MTNSIAYNHYTDIYSLIYENKHIYLPTYVQSRRALRYVLHRYASDAQGRAIDLPPVPLPLKIGVCAFGAALLFFKEIVQARRTRRNGDAYERVQQILAKSSAYKSILSEGYGDPLAKGAKGGEKKQ